jgi:glucose-6-phosphate 1-epimerase
VKLDFGLSSQMLSENFRRAWPYQFGLVYSVTLSPDSLETSLQVQNKDEKAFDFHVLLHSYFRVKVTYVISFLSLFSTSYQHTLTLPLSLSPVQKRTEVPYIMDQSSGAKKN